MNRKTSQIVTAMRKDPDNCNRFSVKCSCGHVNDLACNPTCQNEQCRNPMRDAGTILANNYRPEPRQSRERK